MSKDIRSFFQKGKSSTPSVTKVTPKRKLHVISSDDEESGNNASSKKMKQDTNQYDTKKPQLSKLKELGKLKEASNMFGDNPVKQSFDKRPKEADTAAAATTTTMIIPKLEQTSPKEQTQSKKSPTKSIELANKSQKIEKESIKKEKTSSIEMNKSLNTSESMNSSSICNKSDIITDEERFERKRHTAILYQKYKNRPGPSHPGSKPIPTGKPNCFAGLTFVLSGVYESMEHDEVSELIKKLGGKHTAALSRKTNYLIAGVDAGPAKLAKADELKIPIISEDDLLNLIRKKSGLPEIAKSPVKMETNENDGIELKPKIKAEAKPIRIDEPLPMKQKSNECHEYSAWVDKYKPKTVQEIIGQQGDASNCVKLTKWLEKWHTNHGGANSKKPVRAANPWAKNDDGSSFKAALLSGPPGVGKTTTVTLVCQKLGLDTIEFNASDTRSKRMLKDEVAELLSNRSLYGYAHGLTSATSAQHVLVMDEVDGMAGNEDRGGIQELIQLIKESHVPIVCMCNDRNHPKIRSLVNYCYDLRFNRPRMEQIKGAMLSICCKEQLKLPRGSIDDIIASSNMDIRQTLNYLSLLSANKQIPEMETKQIRTAKKDLKIGPWDVVRKVFSIDDHAGMSINDKSNLFFHDYSIGPLFVQQNYLAVKPKCSPSDIKLRVAETADSLSIGDLIERRIRSKMAWSLLPMQAMFSSVLPGEYMAGRFTSQINFPAWLGKHSKANKRQRLAQEIHDHTRIRTSGSRLSIRLDYAPFLLNHIVRPIKTNGSDGIPETLNILKEYRLLRDDIDSLIELTMWPGKKNPLESIDSRVKTALTRAYNKEISSYTASMACTKKKNATTPIDENQLLDENGDDENGSSVAETNGEDDEDDKDDMDNDVLIKIKKKTVAKGKTTTTTTTTQSASTSKATGRNQRKVK